MLIVLGLLLLLAAAVFGLDLLWRNHGSIPTPHVLGQALDIHDTRTLFLVGIITGATAMLGLALLLAGIGRRGRKAVRRRREAKIADRTAPERDRLRADNESLRSQAVEPADADAGSTADESERRPGLRRGATRGG